MRYSFQAISFIFIVCGVMFSEKGLSGNYRTQPQDYNPIERSSRPLFSKVKLFIIGSLPLGEFGSSNPASINSGFAYPGIGGGADYSAEVIQHCGFTISGMFVIHGYDVSGWKDLIPYWHWDGDSRVIYSLTGGVLYDIDFSPSLNLYGTAQIGILHVNYPNLILRDQLGEEATLLAQSQITTGYKLSLGASIKKVDVSMHFLYGAPEFQATYQYRLEKTLFPPEKKPVRALMVSVGYILN